VMKTAGRFTQGGGFAGQKKPRPSQTASARASSDGGAAEARYMMASGRTYTLAFSIL